MHADLAHADLWHRYKNDRDPEARARLLVAHMGLVHLCAHRLRSRVPYGVALEELVSAGTLGLVQALEGFDAERGLAFSSYSVPRIRGAMLDEVRRLDWRPRSVRARGRRVAEARGRLERALGRAPSSTEMARELGIDDVEYRCWMDDQERGALVSLDDATIDAEEPLSLNEVLSDPEAPGVGDALEREQDRTAMRLAVKRLPARDRTVLSLYYYEELNLREIGEVLGISESRVSQIRSQALRRLREELARRGGTP